MSNLSSSSNSGNSDSVVYVCQSGTCRSKGSDAALLEIEELATLVDPEIVEYGCEVEATGCLGYCSRGPAVAVVNPRIRRRERIYLGVNSLEKSAAVVEGATGARPPLDNLPPEFERRLSLVRATKQREYLVATYKWNKALGSLLHAAKEMSWQQQASPGRSKTLDGRLREEMETILAKAGYPGMSSCDLVLPRTMPAAIENYVLWTLQSVEVISPHSAVFRFETKNPKRGTPHPRGRGRLAKPNTWHVTMLGKTGEAAEGSDDGPLPWIERDYTPISSGLEWERGSCDILIKIYNDGRLTQWLRRRTGASLKVSPGKPKVGAVLLPREEATKIWLSRPIPTLALPSLAPAGDGNDFEPKSVLLLLAGTGIVALPQILAHKEPARMLGISTPRRNQLRCPIDLVHSCRKDDLLLLPEIREFCVEGSRPHPTFRGLRNYTLLMTDESKSSSSLSSPFEGIFETDNTDRCEDILRDLPNAVCKRSQRLDRSIVAEALGRMVQPCRVVVSGPDTYNDAARRFLDECGGISPSQLTVLAA